jgi:hypothetical protein
MRLKKEYWDPGYTVEMDGAFHCSMLFSWLVTALLFGLWARRGESGAFSCTKKLKKAAPR